MNADCQHINNQICCEGKPVSWKDQTLLAGRKSVNQRCHLILIPVNNNKSKNNSEKHATSKIHPRNVIFSHLLFRYHDLPCLLDVPTCEKICVEVDKIIL